tara:strand:- start:363 stop:599 length:237 start_codon:yes stop_codon:yes gene_type:complete
VKLPPTVTITDVALEKSVDDEHDQDPEKPAEQDTVQIDALAVKRTLPDHVPAFGSGHESDSPSDTSPTGPMDGVQTPE